MKEQLPKVKIVQIIAILVLSLCSLSLFGQTKVITQIDNNLYEYRAYNEDGSIHQKGTYIGTEDGKLLVHSYWSDDVGTKALYKRGKLVWIKPKGQPRYTYEQIEYEQMKAEIKRLKAIVALND
jgi:hypothetical protein|tara:strand:+ start:4189 stop:4560 length:372 start_codon:yes stop_codon:yes gene_type:complete